MIYYRQCLMKRKINDNVQAVTSWIPEKYAIKDKVIKLQSRETKEWSDGWIVTMIGIKRIDEKQVVVRSQDYKKTRKASDI